MNVERFERRMRQLRFLQGDNDFMQAWGEKRGRYGAKRKHADRDHSRSWLMLHEQFFSPQATAHLRTVFRVSYKLFKHIAATLKQHNKFWEQRMNAAHRWGVSTEIKILISLKILAQGTSAPAIHNEFGCGEGLVHQCVDNFIADVIVLFEKEFLLSNLEDEEKSRKIILANQAKHGLPGLLGSLDCTHIKWLRCSRRLHSNFVGKSGEPTFTNEAIADSKLRFVHFFAGCGGTMNDINVLRSGTLVTALCNGTYPKFQFSLENHSFSFPYLFVDGIYPGWANLIKAPKSSLENAENFIRRQESIRKDVERAFGVLKIRWKILKYGLNFLKRSKCVKVIRAAVILHNMMIDLSPNSSAETFVQDLIADGIISDARELEEDQDEDVIQEEEESEEEDEEYVEEGEEEETLQERFWFYDERKHTELTTCLIKHFQ